MHCNGRQWKSKGKEQCDRGRNKGRLTASVTTPTAMLCGLMVVIACENRAVKLSNRRLNSEWGLVLWTTQEISVRRTEPLRCSQAKPLGELTRTHFFFLESGSFGVLINHGLYKIAELPHVGDGCHLCCCSDANPE